MSVENPSPDPDLDRQLETISFDAVDDVTRYITSLGIDGRQFSRNADGQLLSAHGTVLTERDSQTGKIRFSRMGINATAERIENLCGIIH